MTVDCLHWHTGLLRRLSSFKTEARDVVNGCYSRLCVLLQLVELQGDAPATKDDVSQRLLFAVVQALAARHRCCSSENVSMPGSSLQQVLEKASGVVEKQLLAWLVARQFLGWSGRQSHVLWLVEVSEHVLRCHV